MEQRPIAIRAMILRAKFCCLKINDNIEFRMNEIEN
jgi:hypothetical protein